MRAGVYSGFTVQAKGLAILGEGAVTVGWPCTVGPTASTQRVLFRNLQFFASLTVSDAAGPVAIEGCTTHLLGSQPTSIVRSPQVRLHGCLVRVDVGTAIGVTDAAVEFVQCRVFGGWRDQPTHGAAILAQRSRCTLVASDLTGGRGSDALCMKYVIHAKPGHAGCELEASVLLSCHSRITGGAGGRAAACASGGAGGAGVKAGNNCTVIVFGALPTGGGAGGGGGLPRGPSYVLGPGSRIVHSPGITTPLASVIGTQRRGQTVLIELHAAPASLAVVAFSYSGLTAPLEPFGVGSLLLQPALISAPFSVPGTGKIALPLFLPLTLPFSEMYTGQALTWQLPGVFASNTFTLLVAQ